MKKQRNKIIELGYAIVVIAITVSVITYTSMSSEIPFSQLLKYGSLFLALFFVPLLLIFGIHYWVLGRMLHNPHPFENFKLGYYGPKLQNPGSEEKHLHAFRFYALSGFASIFALMPLRYLLRKINATKFLWDITTYSASMDMLIQWQFIAPGITIILLIFSQNILGKPLSETWKAILTAGLATGAFAGLYALFFYHFVIPRMGI